MTERLRTGVVLQFAARKRAHLSSLGLDCPQRGTQFFDGTDAGVRPLSPGDPRDGVVVHASMLGDGSPGAGSLARLKRGDDLVEAHDRILGPRALTVKAGTPKARGHHSWVTEELAKETAFHKNLRALIGDGSVNAWAKLYKLEQTTINRIVNGADPKLSMVERIAEAVGISAWQLMVPDLDIKNLPALQQPDAQGLLLERIDGLLSEVKQLRGGAPAPRSATVRETLLNADPPARKRSTR